MRPSTPSAANQPHWGTVVIDFRRALRNRSVSDMCALISRHPLHLYFHIEPAELVSVVQIIDDECSSPKGNVAALRLLMRADPAGAVSVSDLRPPARVGHGVGVAYMAALRLQGNHRDAYDFMLNRMAHSAQPIHSVVDSHDGWPQFRALQNGLTAMLMGDMARALSALEEARWRAVTPGLEVMMRDALAKAALIHASFGDPAAANALIAQCVAIERSTSHAEANVDATCAIVEAMLCPEASEALCQLRKIKLSQIGEVWPFYVQAESRTLDSLGSFSYASSRLTELSALPFAFRLGEGYSGSVLPLMKALNGIATGDPASVRRHLADCDSHFVLTGITKALFALQVGAIPDAIEQALQLRESTRPLRRLTLWRLSILGEAHLADADVPAAIRALQETALLPDPLSTSELGFFSHELLALGKAHVTGWPAGEPSGDGYLDQLPRREHHLTPREIEVLRYLNIHASRRDLAEALFVSPNTLKSQLRSIFKKLGATSREEALHEAALRGVLSEKIKGD